MQLVQCVVVALVGVALLAGSSGEAAAHGSFEARVARATSAIGQAPSDVDLLLRRAELYQRNGHFAEAHADLDRAASLDPAHPETAYQRALLLIQEERPGQALAVLDRLLGTEPDHGPGHLARARTLRSLGRNLGAARAYSRAIAAASAPTPDAFLERAHALAASGPSRLPEAIASLDQGRKVVGPLPALTQTAIDLEVRARLFDAALARLDAEIAASRQPVWALTRKGGVLVAAGREREARAAYAEASRRLGAQPAHRRHSPAWQRLESRITKGLSGSRGIAGLAEARNDGE